MNHSKQLILLFNAQPHPRAQFRAPGHLWNVRPEPRDGMCRVRLKVPPFATR